MNKNIIPLACVVGAVVLALSDNTAAHFISFILVFAAMITGLIFNSIN